MKKHATTISIVLVLLTCVSHADNHVFFDSGSSDSAPRCLADISTTLANELEIKPGIAEALVTHSLELREKDLGPYIGDEQWQGEIEPDSFLDDTAKRKILWAIYDCKESLKTSGEWHWVWSLSIVYRK